MDNIEYAKQNLGAEVIINYDNFTINGIIVGHNSQYIILGLTNNKGWNSFDIDDIILVHSPIIKSYWYTSEQSIMKL